MLFEAAIEFFVYGGIGLLAIILWWAVYDWVLVRQYSLRTALFATFGKQSPNLAVAVELSAGVLSISVAAVSVLSAERLEEWSSDLLALAVQLISVVLLLVLFRYGFAALLKWHFRGQLDAQGSSITLNNELFTQGNLASGLFVGATYLIASCGLLQINWLAGAEAHWASIMNMLAVWVAGILILVLHSWLYLGFFTEHSLLHESFHDNNPAAAISMLGLLAGMMWIESDLLSALPTNASAWTSPLHWALLALVLFTVLIIRGILQMLVLLVLKVNFREALVTSHNLAWGVVDGAFIFGLSWIFHTLVV